MEQDNSSQGLQQGSPNQPLQAQDSPQVEASDQLLFDIDSQARALTDAQRQTELSELTEDDNEAAEAPTPTLPKPAPSEGEEAAKPVTPTPSQPDKRMAQIHAREQALQTRQSELAAAKAEVDKWELTKKRAKANPFEALKLLGFEDPESFLTLVAETGGKMTPEQQELAEIREKLANREKEESEYKQKWEQDQLSRQREAQISQAKAYIAESLAAKPEWKGGLISKYAPDVFETIQAHYLETDEELPFEQAVVRTQQLLHGKLRSILEEALSSEDGRRIVEEVSAKSKPARPAKVTSPQYHQTKRQARDDDEPTVDSIDDEINQMARKLTVQQRRAQAGL